MNIAVRSDETNLIDTNGLSRSELMAILERARFYEDQNGLVPPRYLGRFVANLFLNRAHGRGFLLRWRRNGWAWKC